MRSVFYNSSTINRVKAVNAGTINPVSADSVNLNSTHVRKINFDKSTKNKYFDENEDFPEINDYDSNIDPIETESTILNGKYNFIINQIDIHFNDF